MGIDRRKFIKLAGLGVAGFTLRPAMELTADEFMDDPRAMGGKRWAMVVDLNKCLEQDNCTKCIDACHETHNVPKIENSKDEIKWIWKDTFHHAFHELGNPVLEEILGKESREQEHGPVLMLCNHCENPPCTKVCPTEATWRREDGIVMMDWHRCIGCRYCIVGCPYGARSFNWKNPRPLLDSIDPDFPTRMRGVVEKCTFCEERISRGLQPACVEACEAGALTFGDLEDSESKVRELITDNFTIRRKTSLGTQPQIYYIV